MSDNFACKDFFFCIKKKTNLSTYFSGKIGNKIQQIFSGFFSFFSLSPLLSMKVFFFEYNEFDEHQHKKMNIKQQKEKTTFPRKLN